MSSPEPAPSIGPRLARLTAAFAAPMGGRPRWGARAPGRVNLIGEHTDYNNGFVLPMAIDRDCLCVAAPAADPAWTRVLAADLGEAIAVDARGWLHREMMVRGVDVESGALLDERALADAAWARYPLGVIAQFAGEARRRSRAMANLDIAVSSSVPLGSGLSSSASLEAAVATMLEAATEVVLDPVDKARLCQRAEHTFPGVPCGIMDPFASICGVQDHALLIDCRAETFTRVPMPPPAEAVVLIANTNVHHSLAGGEYARRRAACEGAARTLGVASLREVAAADAEPALGRLSGQERECARHVLSENQRTLEVAELLRTAGSSDWGRTLREIGRRMAESHRSLSQVYRVSCPELDTLVELATAGDSHAVYGARMTGGGFGGCIIALVREEGANDLAKELHRGYRDRHGRDCTIYTTRASPGAGPIDVGPGR